MLTKPFLTLHTCVEDKAHLERAASFRRDAEREQRTDQKDRAELSARLQLFAAF